MGAHAGLEPEGTERTPRSTRQRRAVAAALAATDEFRSAQDIHDTVRRGGDKVALATVYRALQVMAEAGEIDVVKTDAGEAVYRRCSARHHHHLVCRHCGRTLEIEGPTVERWAQELATWHRFTDVSHTLELVGTCPTCQSAGR